MSAALLEQIDAQLFGPGGFFELSEETVFGERMQVFRNRQRSLRETLQQSTQHGEAEYLVEGARRISYAQHARLAASVAAALRERYDIRPGDRVALLSANNVAWPLTFWATVGMGGVVAALNGWWTADEIRYGLEHARPKLLVGDRKRLARLSDRPPDLPVLEIESEFAELERFASGAELPDTPIDEDDPAVVLYTSGTTGRPKGAVSTHRGIIGFVQSAMSAGFRAMRLEAAKREAASAATPGEAEAAAAAAAAPRAQTVSLAAAPMFHLSGLYASLVMRLTLGEKLVLPPQGRFDPEQVLALVEKEKITQVSLFGSMAPRIAKHPRLDAYDRSSVVSVGFGGAPVGPEVQELVRRAFPCAAQSMGIGYGSSETVSSVSIIGGADYAAHPDSAGRISPPHQLEVRAPDGRRLSPGEEGELHVRSAFCMKEYWDDPEATREVFGPGRWLATGDIGRLDHEGLLYINSRARDMILRNAENVYPAEIEQRLDRHPEVRECAVYGVPHESWGQQVKAVVVPEAGAAPTEEQLKAWCAETLAPYKVPTVFEMREAALPRGASGKVLKHVLRGEAQSPFVEE